MLPDGTHTDIIVGEVLLARHPCKLPTDIRKVRLEISGWSATMRSSVVLSITYLTPLSKIEHK